MPRTRIKICGVRDADAARAAVDAGADAIGLVFVAGSPRHVTVAQAREVVDHLPAFVEPVGLFVDATADEIRKTCDEVGLRMVQLHGKEKTQFAASLAPLRFVKAFAFAPGSEGGNVSDLLAPWSGPRNFAAALWDAPPPPPTDKKGQPLPGGSGVAFSWKDLASLKNSGSLPAWAPLILAGGLTPQNVGEAIALLEPYAVDVSSGVESSRGVKDTAKIHAFCDAVRKADARK